MNFATKGIRITHTLNTSLNFKRQLLSVIEIYYQIKRQFELTTIKIVKYFCRVIHNYKYSRIFARKD